MSVEKFSLGYGDQAGSRRTAAYSLVQTSVDTFGVEYRLYASREGWTIRYRVGSRWRHYGSFGSEGEALGVWWDLS